jgi:hypothetical protein
MKLKKTKTGFMLHCANTSCKSVWWLPKCVKSGKRNTIGILNLCLQVSLAMPSDIACVSCSAPSIPVFKLKLSFNLASAVPGMPPNAEICPICDPLWKDIHFAPLPKKVRSNNIFGQIMQHPMNQNDVSPRQFNSSLSNQGHSTPHRIITHNNYSTPVQNHQISNNMNSLLDDNNSVVMKQTLNSNYSDTIPINPSALNSISHTFPQPSMPSSAPSSILFCQCNIPVKIATTTKEGANKGRQFYSCSQRFEVNHLLM